MNVMQATRQEWRHNTEFMLNLPETEGIAKLYEASASSAHCDSRGDQAREKGRISRYKFYIVLYGIIRYYTA